MEVLRSCNVTITKVCYNAGILQNERSLIMEEDYIGKWVTSGEYVEYDRILEDLVIIKANPDEFDFSYEFAIEIAADIVGRPQRIIEFEALCFYREKERDG